MVVEGHLAGGEAENGVGMGGAIIEEVCDGDGGCSGAFCLSRCKDPECHQHGGVDCPSIVEKDADDLLESCELLGGEGWCGVVFCCILDFGAVRGCGPGMHVMHAALGWGLDAVTWCGLGRRSRAWRRRWCG